MSYDMECCPFCQRYGIEVFKRRGSWTVKSTGRNSLGGGKSAHKSADVFLIQSGCHLCGKTREEVEAWFR